ncbi:MAG TPA: hypothetical protein VGH38_14115 [Bryobacteraceae bacterium]|jgi:hypothetical protein
MTQTFVFLGSVSEVMGAGLKLTRRGQRFDATPEVADGTRRKGGVPAIPAERFDALGMTEQELHKYGPAAAFDRAPAAFQAKMHQAFQILAEIRAAEAAKPAEAPPDGAKEQE